MFFCLFFFLGAGCDGVWGLGFRVSGGGRTRGFGGFRFRGLGSRGLRVLGLRVLGG